MGNQSSSHWVTIIVAIIGVIGVIIAAIIARESGERAAVEVAIAATMTAEAKQITPTQVLEVKPTNINTDISPTLTQAVTLTPQAADTPKPIYTVTPVLPTATFTPIPATNTPLPIPTIPLPTPIPSATIAPNFVIGQVYREKMKSGLLGQARNGGVWFGTYRHLALSNNLKGQMLHVETESGSYKLRIEIWEGFIASNDHEWWTLHRQIALSDGTGDSPRTVIDPKLIWEIEPGQYTVFFASQYDQIIDYEISYSIDVKSD